MLIKCPECDLQVSDRAFACPHCGYPLKEQPKPVRKSTHKRRRLPNGFGQISELKGRNLRKPFRAMVTVGKTPKGRPICKLLKPEAFFETYNDAYAALVEYNRNPYDLDTSITMDELYEKWKDYYVQSGNSERSLSALKYVWDYCNQIKRMRVKDVRSRHINGCIENACMHKPDGTVKEASASTKNKIKSLFNSMFDYAVRYDIADKNYSRAFSLPRKVFDEMENNRTEHIPYSDEEMDLLWKNIDRYPIIEAVLFQCYTGMRPQEVGLIKMENVNLEDRTIIGGMKTQAGTNRLVPIHSRILEIVKDKYKLAQSLQSDYLFNYITDEGYELLTYDRFKISYRQMRNALKLSPQHRPHDGRAHFITAAKKYNVDENILKRIVGHKISDITESIYTKRDSSWMLEEIEKIK